MPYAKNTSTSSLEFKVATEDWEIDAIHRLNHKTFVEEIPQHRPREAGRLVDQFHEENTYLICLRDRELLGMVAVRDQRPFSLEKKLPDLEAYLPSHQSICEIRLLSVAPDARRTSVVGGLMSLLADHVQSGGYELGVISGTVRQLKLYQHLGFVSFGPTVGTAEAMYQPMYMTAESLSRIRSKSRALARGAISKSGVNLLPGPCTLSAEVRKALGGQPISHRSAAFRTQFEGLQHRLCTLTQADRVFILSGAGTLANDTIAAQLEGHGLLLSNGEFGRRLMDHATRAGLSFDVVEAADGQPFEYDALPDSGQYAWTWMVQLETSTGVLNRPERIVTPRLILDAVSAIGVTPVDFSQVYLASGVSGKGLNSAPGLALVFTSHATVLRSSPRTMDLGLYEAHEGIPFTISTNQVAALDAAVSQIDFFQRLAGIKVTSDRLRAAIELRTIADPAYTCPAVLTFQVPRGQSSMELGEHLEKQEIFVSYRSAYLRAANRIQLCLMSNSPVPVERVAAAINQKF